MSNRKIPRKSINFTRWILVVLLLVAITSAGILTDHYAKRKPSTQVNTVNGINYGPSSPQDNAPNNTRKSSPPSTSTQTLNTPPTTSSNPQPTPSNPQGISVTITRANVINNSLQVATIIGNAAAGTCTLTVSQSGQQSITQTEAVQLQGNVYVCPVFSIPVDNFPDLSGWNVSVSVTDNTSTATGQWQGNPVNL